MTSHLFKLGVVWFGLSKFQDTGLKLYGKSGIATEEKADHLLELLQVPSGLHIYDGAPLIGIIKVRESKSSNKKYVFLTIYEYGDLDVDNRTTYYAATIYYRYDGFHPEPKVIFSLLNKELTTAATIHNGKEKEQVDVFLTEKTLESFKGPSFKSEKSLQLFYVEDAAASDSLNFITNILHNKQHNYRYSFFTSNHKIIKKAEVSTTILKIGNNTQIGNSEINKSNKQKLEEDYICSHPVSSTNFQKEQEQHKATINEEDISPILDETLPPIEKGPNDIESDTATANTQTSEDTKSLQITHFDLFRIVGLLILIPSIILLLNPFELSTSDTTQQKQNAIETQKDSSKTVIQDGLLKKSQTPSAISFGNTNIIKKDTANLTSNASIFNLKGVNASLEEKLTVNLSDIESYYRKGIYKRYVHDYYMKVLDEIMKSESAEHIDKLDSAYDLQKKLNHFKQAPRVDRIICLITEDNQILYAIYLNRTLSQKEITKFKEHLSIDYDWEEKTLSIHSTKGGIFYKTIGKPTNKGCDILKIDKVYHHKIVLKTKRFRSYITKDNIKNINGSPSQRGAIVIYFPHE